MRIIKKVVISILVGLLICNTTVFADDLKISVNINTDQISINNLNYSISMIINKL
jgi:hypothetical protein